MFGVENTFIVSSTKEYHKTEKIEHAKHYFGVDETQFIPVNKEKYHITKEGILIDDYPLHVMEHVAYNRKKGIVFNLDNRFGWCRKCNYVIDDTLTDLMHIIDDSNFTIATSYQHILEELSNE